MILLAVRLARPGLGSTWLSPSSPETGVRWLWPFQQKLTVFSILQHACSTYVILLILLLLGLDHTHIHALEFRLGLLLGNLGMARSSGIQGQATIGISMGQNACTAPIQALVSSQFANIKPGKPGKPPQGRLQQDYSSLLRLLQRPRLWPAATIKDWRYTASNACVSRLASYADMAFQGGG